MSYIIQFEKGLLADFNKAIEHYEKISKELADRFYNEFWNVIMYLKENPLHHQLRYRSIRIAHLKVFPYGIHFIVDDAVIKVFKVMHYKQFYK